MSAGGRMGEVTTALGGRMAFGGDYNPEQWPPKTVSEDIDLMQQAGVNLVTVGVFSWTYLEPEEGRYDFGPLDTLLDRLHEAGIRVDLATGTASPPAWFLPAHPEAALVDSSGTRREFGARQGYCPSSTAYRRASTELASALASRYAEHPAVVMWHVNNEYGCHNWHCYCEESAQAFRTWLRARHETLENVNDAWGTAFWSQRYTKWDQVQPPREVAYNSFANPCQQLDWWRFSSDELLACFGAEAEAIRAVAAQPITTNFMGFFKPLDYRAWAIQQDIVSNDHYLLGADRNGVQQLAMTSDLIRTLAGGRPWLQMEQSTSAVNWQARNLAKAPGQLLRNAMQHVARGSDGALFFQWRASRAGAEKFHSALVPHAGTETRVWREVVDLGAKLNRIAEVAGSVVEPAPVGIMFDWSSWWAAELDSHPTVDTSPLGTARRWHEQCWRSSIGVDLVGPDAALGSYRLIVVPVQYVMSDATADALRAYVTAGGTLLVTYFSGIVDEHDRIVLGGYPGRLRDLLGITVEEFAPLAEGMSVGLDAYDRGTVWSEYARATSADVVARYLDGPTQGSAAITRHQVGAGRAWYLGTELSDEGLATLAAEVFDEAGVVPVVDGLPEGVEATRRRSDEATYVFLVNHTGERCETEVAGTDLLSGTTSERVVVAAGAVAVVREH